MSKIIKVTIQFDDKLLQLSEDQAEKWQRHNETIANFTTVHNNNPFISDPVNWEETVLIHDFSEEYEKLKNFGNRKELSSEDKMKNLKQDNPDLYNEFLKIIKEGEKELSQQDIILPVTVPLHVDNEYINEKIEEVIDQNSSETDKLDEVPDESVKDIISTFIGEEVPQETTKDQPVDENRKDTIIDQDQKSPVVSKKGPKAKNK